MKAKPNDITKLPKWAQDEITRLTSNLATKEAEILGLASGTGKIVYAPYGQFTGKKARSIPDDETIRFNNSGDGYVEINQNRDGTISIRSQKSLLIFPGASNSITVKSANT